MTMDHCIPRTSTFITSPQQGTGYRCRRPTAPNPASHSFRQMRPIGQKSFFFPIELSNRRIVARANVCSPTANGSPTSRGIHRLPTFALEFARRRPSQISLHRVKSSPIFADRCLPAVYPGSTAHEKGERRAQSVHFGRDDTPLP